MENIRFHYISVLYDKQLQATWVHGAHELLTGLCMSRVIEVLSQMGWRLHSNTMLDDTLLLQVWESEA